MRILIKGVILGIKAFPPVDTTAGTVHVGTVMVSFEVVVTDPAPNVKALPTQVTALFSVIAFALSITVPLN